MITVLGYDGSPLSLAGAAALAGADLVVGADRSLAAVDLSVGARRLVMGDVRDAVAQVAAFPGDVVILASGDPGLFGIVRRLRAAGLAPRVHPGVSSVAAAFARAGLRWDDAEVVSAHGRDPRLAVNVCRRADKTAVLTAPGAGPRELGRELTGWPQRALFVAECLGERDERTGWCSPQEAAGRTDWREPNVVLAVAARLVPGTGDRAGGGQGGRIEDRPEDGLQSPAEDPDAPMPWRLGGLGVPDGWALPETAFEHRDSMITKAEVRAAALARLAPAPGHLVWDVGAGSGSVGVECARFGAAVLAVERDAAACRLVAVNAARHDVPVRVVEGEAPDVLAGLPAPDAVFLGGGGPEVLRACIAAGPSRVVAALAALDRVANCRDALREGGYAVDGVLLHASRLAALPDASSRLAATNPVFVLSGERA